MDFFGASGSPFLQLEIVRELLLLILTGSLPVVSAHGFIVASVIAFIVPIWHFTGRGWAGIVLLDRFLLRSILYQKHQ